MLNSMLPVPEKVIAKPKIDIEKIVRLTLPPLPQSAIRISELLKNLNVSTSALADVIKYDPLLTTRVLQLANSPIYFQRNTVATLVHAIEVVGTASLYDIVMLGITADVFAKEISKTILGRKIWEHSLAVALLAKELSKISNTVGAEEAFLCGLLHDIGKIMLLRADANNYAGILEQKTVSNILDWERNLFGYDHAQIGALVVRRWRLPENVCFAILNHHYDSQSSGLVMSAHLVNLADTIVNIHGFGLHREDESSLLSSESAMILQISEADLHTAWESIQDNLKYVISVLT
jgi:putative nucleotidyltransferase with HDIG domain